MAYFGRPPYQYVQPYNFALDDGTQTSPSIAFRDDTNTGIFSPSNDNIAITTAGTERLRVTDLGNVGIGTTNPTIKLHLIGNQIITNIGGSSVLNIGEGTTTNQFALIDLTGDTTYTDYGLRIIRDNQGANSDSNIYHRGTGALRLYTVEAAPIDFRVSNSASISRYTATGDFLINSATPTGTSDQKLQVTGGAFISGNVGIGTTNPSASLNLMGNMRFGSNIDSDIDYSIRTGGQLLIHANDNATQNSNFTNLLLRSGFHSEGHSRSFIHIVGDTFIRQIVFGTDSTTRMVMDADGNLGIGITNPSSKLQVNGSVTEIYSSVYRNIVSEADIGFESNQIPLNQYLGKLAFLDEIDNIRPSSHSPVNNLDINFQRVSDTSINIRMRGSDGVVRSVTLTLA